MLKVLLFALLAIGLSFCDQGSPDADQLYASLLPEGEKPMFEIKNGEAQQSLLITREGDNGLVFKVESTKNEATFKFNEKMYILYAFKIMFEDENSASLEIQFQQRNAATAPTNIAIKSKITDKLDMKGEHGVTAEILSVDMITFLIGSKNARQKSTVTPIKWIVDCITTKKPMFLNIQRNPATLEFALPPVVLNEDEFSKLLQLKDKLKATYKEQFNKLVTSGTNLIGGSRKKNNE